VGVDGFNQTVSVGHY